MARPSPPRLRPVSTADLPALYAISLATGAAGDDATDQYVDGRLLGHIYSAPYATLSPETAFVAEDDLGVGGYVVGAVDTRVFEARLEREWWPRLRAIYDDPSATPPSMRTPDQHRAHMIHHPHRMTGAMIETFPAHVHMNLLPRMQRRGIGRRFLELWLSAAQRLGATGVHCGVNAANHRGLAFWQAVGFAPYDVAGEISGRTRWFVRALDAPAGLRVTR
jgi:GNAT superfamily N-acetyltransferase